MREIGRGGGFQGGSRSRKEGEEETECRGGGVVCDFSQTLCLHFGELTS